MGTNFIFISGGEPFVLWEGLRDLIERHSDVAFQIYSNGQLIDDTVARELGRLGNAAVGISIEGTEASTDGRRGAGVHQGILAAMDRLRARGVLFGFSITATTKNFEDVLDDAFAEEMIGRGCLYGWFFTYLPVGQVPDLSLMLRPEQRGRLRDRVVELRRRYPLFLVDFWNDGQLTGGCMAGGRKYLHVNHNGDVEPCVFSHFAVDNIKGRSLADVLKSPFFREIRSRIPYSENLLRPCMIIDHPELLREMVTRHGARPTHAGAEGLLSELAPSLDAYAQEYAGVADAKWRPRDR
jgi:MoaA/NifB/PqqE/SkfB family radical SAM enzyme